MSEVDLKEIAKELEEIGLTEKEAKVYLALLEVGQETVQNISKKANVNRATTYVILESLQKKGVVTTFEQGKKTLFVAEGPSSLYNIIREQQEELEKKDNELDGMMPQLMSVYNLHPDKPEVKFYEGKEGLKEMQRDFLGSGADEARMIFAKGDVGAIFNEEERNEVYEKRLKNKIHAITIENIDDDSSDGNETKPRLVESKEKLFTSLEVSFEDYPFSSDVTIYENKVMMAFLKGHISGIIINSSVIADTLRNVFDLAFKKR